MAQPALGVIASVIVMALSLGFISLFNFPRFAGPVAFFNLCLIPFQVMAVVLWGANPPFVAKLSQPVKGLALVIVTIIAAAIIDPIALRLIGGGAAVAPLMIPSHYVILVVPTTFYLCIIFGGWPFTAAIKNSVAAGLAVLVASYVITYAVFYGLFDYSFLPPAAPEYLPNAPHGAYNGVMALVYYVTILAAMFVILCFDLWPLPTMPGIMKQPVLGVVWLLLAMAIAAVAMYVGVAAMGMDPMIFLTRVTAPVIFGAIIVLNMLQNSLFASMAQPVKGIANTITAIVVGSVLAQLYGALVPMVTGQLPSGPPGYEYEIWLANALLSVTFPFLIFYAVYWGYWPLAKPAPQAQAAAQRT